MSYPLPWIAVAALLVLTAAPKASSEEAVGAGVPYSAADILLQVKSDCCKACYKPTDGKKKCKTFCGKHAADKCNAYELHGSKKSPDLKLEDHSCYPICKDQCLKTRGSLTFEQCVMDCLNRTRC